MRKLIVVLLGLSILMGACERGPSANELELQKQLQELQEQQRMAEQEKLKAEEQADKDAIQQEIDALKTQLQNKEKQIQDKQKEIEIEKKKPPPAPKFGPGNMNGSNNAYSGWVRVCTRSVKGELTLRTGASQSSSPVNDYNGKPIYIPNGTSGIYYEGFTVNGEHTWYNVWWEDVYSHMSYKGWLRGDYLCQ